MAKSKTKLPKGLSLHASGQYRADIDSKTLYLGTNSKEAYEKYDLYKTTKLLWSRQYHQYVKEIAGTIRILALHQSKPKPIMSVLLLIIGSKVQNQNSTNNKS